MGSDISCAAVFRLVGQLCDITRSCRLCIYSYSMEKKIRLTTNVRFALTGNKNTKTNTKTP